MPKDDLDHDLLESEGDAPETLDDADLEDLDEEDLDGDAANIGEADPEGEDEDEIGDDGEEGLVEAEPSDVVVPAAVAPARPASRDDEDEEEDDDEEDNDDVEASLDVILKERMVVDDDEEDDDVVDGEDRGDGPSKVLPKQPGEFVCQSCFLVKHPSQLADPQRVLCRDCV